MEAIAQGREPFKIKVDEDGIFKVDTFKGFAKTSDVKLGSENMPSSEGEKGLIRDKNGKVVFS